MGAAMNWSIWRVPTYGIDRPDRAVGRQLFMQPYNRGRYRRSVRRLRRDESNHSNKAMFTRSNINVGFHATDRTKGALPLQNPPGTTGRLFAIVSPDEAVSA